MAVDFGKIDAVILGGGLGTRLRSAIGEKQKIMAPVDGRPFLDLQLEYLGAQGFRRVILCTGYQASDVEAHYRTPPFGLVLVFSTEQEPLGTGGAVKNAESLIHSDPFVVLNGDSFCPLDYQGMMNAHVQRKASVTIAVSRVEDRRDFGSIVLDGQGRITAFQEKIVPDGSAGAAYVNAGIYILNREILSAMPQAKFSFERDFFPPLCARPQKDIYGFPVDRPFLDIGTPQRYEQAKDSLRKG